MAARKQTEAERKAAKERALKLRRDRHALKKATELAQKAMDGNVEFDKLSAEARKKLDPAERIREGAKLGGSQSPKVMTQARDNLSLAFDLVGGVPALVAWGRLNPTEFYRIWARLIPKEAVEPTNEMPLERLLGMLAAKSEKSVAEAAYEIGSETLLAAREEISIEDAQEALRQAEGATRQ